MTAPLQYGTPPDRDPTAVMGRRTLAWIADLLLFTTVVAVAFASMGEYVDVPPGTAEPCEELRDQAASRGEDIGSCLDFRDMEIEGAENRVYLLDTDESGVQTLVSFGWFAVFVVIQGLTGGSPGKLLFGLRVVDQYGARIGMGKSLVRTLMWIVDAAPWIIPLVGPITAFTSTGHRRVGDLAAGTYVVSTSSVGQPVMPGSAPIPAGQTAWGASPPTSPPPATPSWESPPAHTDWTTATEAPTPADPSPFAAPGGERPPAASSEPPSAEPRHELPPPQWDAARGTYLQWEPNREAWLQWDASAGRWKPIDT